MGEAELQAVEDRYPDLEYEDFDAAYAEAEAEERPYGFKYGGEKFIADLNPDAGALLTWMRHGSQIEAIPQLLLCFLVEEDVERILKMRGNKWAKAEGLIERLAKEMTGGEEGKPQG